MAIPKTQLEDLLRAVPTDRLRRLAKHFTRMQGVNPPEFYVERMATVERVGFVISDLTWEELQPVAKRAGLEPAGLTAYPLKKRLLARLELYSDIQAAGKGRSPTARQTFEMVSQNVAYETIWKHLQIRREALSETVWTEGERLARLTLACAASAGGRMAVASNVFLELVEDWPEPFLGALRQIGATRSAELLEATYAKQFAAIPPSATVDERSTVLRQHVPDFPGEAQDWKREWSATREAVDTLARAYLTARPELFRE